MKTTQKTEYTLKTYYDEESKQDGEVLDETTFETEGHLKRFSQWINFVRTKVEELELSDENLDELGLNLTRHRDLYHLYFKRRMWKKLIEVLDEFEGWVDYRSEWEQPEKNQITPNH